MNSLHSELSLCQTKDSAGRKLAKAQLILDYNPEFNSLGQWMPFFFFWDAMITNLLKLNYIKIKQKLCLPDLSELGWDMSVMIP